MADQPAPTSGWASLNCYHLWCYSGCNLGQPSGPAPNPGTVTFQVYGIVIPSLWSRDFKSIWFQTHEMEHPSLCVILPLPSWLTRVTSALVPVNQTRSQLKKSLQVSTFFRLSFKLTFKLKALLSVSCDIFECSKLEVFTEPCQGLTVSWTSRPLDLPRAGYESKSRKVSPLHLQKWNALSVCMASWSLTHQTLDFDRTQVSKPLEVSSGPEFVTEQFSWRFSKGFYSEILKFRKCYHKTCKVDFHSTD